MNPSLWRARASSLLGSWQEASPALLLGPVSKGRLLLGKLGPLGWVLWGQGGLAEGQEDIQGDFPFPSLC